MSTRLSKDERKALLNAITDRFNQDELTRRLDLELDRQLDEVVDLNKPFREVVFDLLAAASRHGWIDSLIKGLSEWRPDEPVFRGLTLRLAGSQTPSPGRESVLERLSRSDGLEQDTGPLNPVAWSNAGRSATRQPRKAPIVTGQDPFAKLGPDHRYALLEFRSTLEVISEAIARRKPTGVVGDVFVDLMQILDSDALPSDDDVEALMKTSTAQIAACPDPVIGAMLVTALGARTCARATDANDPEVVARIAKASQRAYSELERVLGARLADSSEPEWVHWRIEELTWKMQVELADLLVAAVRDQDTRFKQTQAQGSAGSKQQWADSLPKDARWATRNTPTRDQTTPTR